MVTDELPWLLENFEGGAGELQRVWDNRLAKKPVLALLLGTSLVAACPAGAVPSTLLSAVASSNVTPRTTSGFAGAAQTLGVGEPVQRRSVLQVHDGRRDDDGGGDQQRTDREAAVHPNPLAGPEPGSVDEGGDAHDHGRG
ncbi:MAG: hypothetical protein ACYCU5_06440 [Actinomycetes bacterium]